MTLSEQTTVHDAVHPFADGELTPAEADAFRAHLGGCARCQQELADILQLQALSPVQAAAKPAPVRALRVPPVVWRGALALAASLLVVGLISVLRREQTSAPVALALAPSRSLEARVAYGPARDWRPYTVLRAGEQTPEAVPLTALAQLEAKGDWHALGVAQLLRGDLSAAQAALDKAEPSADVEADRAALALARGDAVEALARAKAALALAPSHPAARWNYGLAARALALPALASRAFSVLAGSGEAGWAGEAQERERALARELLPRERVAPAMLEGGGSPVAEPPERCEGESAKACALAWARKADEAVRAGVPQAGALVARAQAEALRAEAYDVEGALLGVREAQARREGREALAQALAEEAQARAH